MYGDPQLSQQNQKPHGKTENLTTKTKPYGKTKILTAETKYFTTKPKPSQQNQRPHGKTKYFTAKTKYLNCEVFGFAMRFLVFLRGILFLP